MVSGFPDRVRSFEECLAGVCGCTLDQASLPFCFKTGLHI